MAVNSKRITLKRTRPNPLFHEWLQELHQEARRKKSKLERLLEGAISSLLKYPLPLQTGAECAILQGFNSNLCTFLDKCLKKYSKSKKRKNNSSKASQVNLLEILPNPREITNGKNNTKNDLKKTSKEITLKPSIPTSGTCETIDSSLNEIEKLPELKKLPELPELPKLPELPAKENIEVNKNGYSSKLAQTEISNCHSLRKFRKKTLEYHPVYKSGCYAIMMGLWEHCNLHPNQGVNKKDLLKLAHKYSEEAMNAATASTCNSMWANMARLISMGLVVRLKLALYRMTESGMKAAKVLFDEYKNNERTKHTKTPEDDRKDKSKNKDAVDSNDAGKKDLVPDVEMEAGTYDIILLIDVNETTGLTKKNDPLMAQLKKYPNLRHEYRCLCVGDFTWIAKNKVSKEELVLPYIVERKRLDDLAASIKDGRFHEQKFRLKKCRANVIYMVENYDKYLGLPPKTLIQGMMNTRIKNGFNVHITESLEGSVRFLAIITSRLLQQYKDTALKGHNKRAEEEMLMTFDYFSKAFMKSRPLSVRYNFVKILLQLRGLSVEKALAITNKYKTPRSLMQAYEKCNEKEGENLLANIKCEYSHKVGPRISKIVYHLFMSMQYP